MNTEELGSFTREMSYRATNNFTILSFSALALSYQFSHTLGNKCNWLLIVSWGFLFCSGLCGGWIVVKQPVYYRNNFYKAKIEDYIKLINNPQFQQEVELGNAFIDNNTKWTKENLNKTIKEEYEKMNLVDMLMKELEKKFPVFHQLQAVFFIIGIVMNGTFASLNLL